MQSYSTLKAVTTRATVSGLKPGTRYMFQVRARTSAGCGRFSQAMEVETGKPRECRERGGQGAGPGRAPGPWRSEEGNVPSWCLCWIGIFTGEKPRLREAERLAQGDRASDSAPTTGFHTEYQCDWQASWCPCQHDHLVIIPETLQ